MNELYDLEYRFEHTGSNGVVPLSDEELDKLNDLYEELVNYFKKTNNRIIEYYFIHKATGVERCIFNRSFK